MLGKDLDTLQLSTLELYEKFKDTHDYEISELDLSNKCEITSSQCNDYAE
mgnify:FL=1